MRSSKKKHIESRRIVVSSGILATDIGFIYYTENDFELLYDILLNFK